MIMTSPSSLLLPLIPTTVTILKITGGTPSGTSSTASPNIGEQPSTKIRSEQVPPACQSHFENYKNASTGLQVLVALSVLEQCITHEVNKEVERFVSQLSCAQIREIAEELSVWESFAVGAATSVVGGAVCQRFGPKMGLNAYVTPASCSVVAAAAGTACLLTG